MASRDTHYASVRWVKSKYILKTSKYKNIFISIPTMSSYTFQTSSSLSLLLPPCQHHNDVWGSKWRCENGTCSLTMENKGMWQWKCIDWGGWWHIHIVNCEKYINVCTPYAYSQLQTINALIHISSHVSIHCSKHPSAPRHHTLSTSLLHHQL